MIHRAVVGENGREHMPLVGLQIGPPDRGMAAQVESGDHAVIRERVEWVGRRVVVEQLGVVGEGVSQTGIEGRRVLEIDICPQLPLPEGR